MKKLIALLFFMCFVFAVGAQSGDISGRVFNENGKELAHARVMVVNNGGVNRTNETASDKHGNYTIKNLSPGKYTVACICKGYMNAVGQNIVVTTGKTTFFDFRLKIWIKM